MITSAKMGSLRFGGGYPVASNAGGLLSQGGWGLRQKTVARECLVGELASRFYANDRQPGGIEQADLD